jgi:hypothetical protein
LLLLIMSKINLYLIVAVVFMLSGCREGKLNSDYEESKPKEEVSVSRPDGNRKFEVVIIDGCEYLFCPWPNQAMLTHKGNCKFCLKRGAAK